METKLNELRFTTSDPDKCVGFYLARNAVKRWTEEFVNQESGEIMEIERAEVLMERGTHIIGEKEAQLRFYFQAGELSEVTLTDQSRQAAPIDNGQIGLWLITARLNNKNRKLVLYARNLEQSIQICKDFIELNFEGRFEFRSAKGFTDCTTITSKIAELGRIPKEGEESNELDGTDESRRGEFYMMRVQLNDYMGSRTKEYLVYDSNVDEARKQVELFIAAGLNAAFEAGNIEAKDVEFTMNVESATIVNCYCVVPPEFSKAYFDAEKETENKED